MKFAATRQRHDITALRKEVSRQEVLRRHRDHILTLRRDIMRALTKGDIGHNILEFFSQLEVELRHAGLIAAILAVSGGDASDKKAFDRMLLKHVSILAERHKN